MQTCFKEFYDFHPMQFQVRGPGRTWDGELQRDDAKMGKKRFAEKWEKVRKKWIDWLINCFHLQSFSVVHWGLFGPCGKGVIRCDFQGGSFESKFAQSEFAQSESQHVFFLPQKFWIAFVLPKISCEVSEIHLCPEFRSWWEHVFFLLRCPVLWKRLIGCVPFCVPESMKASLSHVSQLHRTPSNGNL